MRTLYAKFWDRVDLDGPVPEHAPELGPCAVWKLVPNNSGYGQWQGTCAHRFSYEFQVGPIPPGMLVLHRCDNRPCVRASHLFLGTSRDNMRDMVAKGRGHDVTGENNPCARLTAELVARMRQEHEDGARGVDLALKYDVTTSTVSVIVNNKAWVA